MKIKGLFFSYISLVSISIFAFFTIELFSLNQVELDFDSLSFIPTEAEFVLRIEAKNLGNDLVNEIIEKNLWSELNQFKKTKFKNEPSRFNFSQIDYHYPIYLFSHSINSEIAIITVFKLNDPTNYKGPSNQSNQFSFVLGDKCFFVSNCSNKHKNELIKIISKSKSKNWQSILKTEHKLAYKTQFLNLEGGIDIESNKIELTSTSNSYFKKQAREFETLVPNDFHFSIANLSSYRDFQYYFSNSLLKNFSKIKSISVNYSGIVSPFYPQFEMLINTSHDFELNEFITQFDFNEISLNNDQIEIAGLKYYFKKMNKNQYLLSSINNKPLKINSTSDLVYISGNLTTITNLDDAPLLKLFLSSDQRFISFSNFAQKTKKIECEISETNKGNLKATAEVKMKEQNPSIIELFKLIFSMSN